MAFIGILLTLPIFAAIAGLIIAMFVFMGICVMVIGITGILMNKMHRILTQSECAVSNRVYNIGSILLGIFIILLPAGAFLFGLISLSLNG